ncbi:MAG: NAD(+)/NADH kinase [Candidatus Pacebacteria bacterium]|nr:NAD(+)/NADH kinase [Candidatus Paceibacterota bacterium]
MNKKISKIAFYFNSKNKRALKAFNLIKSYINKKYPFIVLNDKNPDVIFVLGGDGMIIRAVKSFNYINSLFFGLNLGKVGFLTSVRDSKDFLKSIDEFLKGNYFVSTRNLLKVEVVRDNVVLFRDDVLNEIVVQSLVGVVCADILIDDFLFQHIRGTGVLVSTPTGSTAYNLSAHGPVIMPNIECFVLTELMDHNIPTPSLVIPKDKKIRIDIVDFREKELFLLKSKNISCDVMLVSDGSNLFALKKGDKINIKNNIKKIKLVELEKDYFLSSLKNKFYVK